MSLAEARRGVPATDARTACEEPPWYVEAFAKDGLVVVEDVLSAEGVAAAVRGFDESLRLRGAEARDGESLRRLSSTAGGVLDLFYEPWKLEATANNERYARIYRDLLRHTYARNEGEWRHPHGAIDAEFCFAHVDRVGCRPSGHARFLSPHLDCCPDNMYPSDAARWRPIQCLLALSGGDGPDEGGFEAVRGFHREFDRYYARRRRPLPAVGEFVALTPVDDADLLRRMSHVRVPAGAALFWDRRLPHANARRNDNLLPRRVVYGGFLPDVPLNRRYASQQRDRCIRAEPQPDFWIARRDGDDFLKPSPAALAACLAALPPPAKARLGF
mmetsp:Transcript_6119/g.18468  ORF Transcript_6119/g.18468 Transcript_6119/m.18468 type:complete len:330 (+) Transcript_6119:2-991(+)